MGSARRTYFAHTRFKTITRYAYKRIDADQPMPGVLEVSRRVPIGAAIEDILLLAEYSLEGEWDGQIRYLPLR
ncbi:MAG: hypothetical protein V3S16_06220 [Candidatus Desulfatibia sp.]|uniref:hypothetical protein n=1 Tax=Candidatus Desulfatibia sp. TaxID=3101189 RepID=UPI002F30CC38